ncbi:hypothetical protein C5167_034018 [Papaver somniferum]|uniref:Uncharacterized protein n=1 Tax=Papaver somniferum TaxID=3469 RepID=A0A4Y7KEU4_PAPSO|nr:hypothetical protein C5167_034018 [Papaver somniferum]
MENGMETLILYSPSETAQQVQNKNSNFGSEKLQLVNFFSGEAKSSHTKSNRDGARQGEPDLYQIKSGRGEVKPSFTKSNRDEARRNRATPN